MGGKMVVPLADLMVSAPMPGKEYFLNQMVVVLGEGEWGYLAEM